MQPRQEHKGGLFLTLIAFHDKPHLQPAEREESLELEESTEREGEDGQGEGETELDKELAEEVSFKSILKVVGDNLLRR